MSVIKDLLHTPLRKNMGTRGAMLMLVGAYIAYMGYKMYQNTVNGESSMPMKLTIVLMAVMMLAGLAVIVYGGFALYRSWQAYRKENLPSENEQDK